MDKMKRSKYDAIVCFYLPIHIKNDEGDTIPIYGILYDKDARHKDDLWTWQLNRYICFLQGCERVQINGGKLAPEVWYTYSGRMIELTNQHKNFIYRIMKKDMMDYRITEFVSPIEYKPEEIDDIFIISEELMKRYNQFPYKLTQK